MPLTMEVLGALGDFKFGDNLDALIDEAATLVVKYDREAVVNVRLIISKLGTDGEKIFVVGRIKSALPITDGKVLTVQHHEGIFESLPLPEPEEKP